MRYSQPRLRPLSGISPAICNDGSAATGTTAAGCGIGNGYAPGFCAAFGTAAGGRCDSVGAEAAGFGCLDGDIAADSCGNGITFGPGVGERCNAGGGGTT